ncbi:MAG: HAMP domain-containing protein [Dehalococcoidia bacterium]|nr:HAMP domain-containing protein [Dehalococcoidia bacterium]
MFHSIQWRITIPFVLIVLVSMGVLGLYLVDFVRGTQINNLRLQLEEEAKLVAQASLPGFLAADRNELDTLAKTAGGQINTRVTIMAKDGTVLGDSDHDPKTMENHAIRPEVVGALASGVGASTRYSTTLEQQMLYVAVPITVDGQVVGIARVALPLAEVEKSVNILIASVVLSMAIATLLVILAAAIITRRATQPIKQLTQAAGRIAAGELEQKIPVLINDESGKLAEAFNEMSSSLKALVADISDEKSKLANILSNIADGVIITDDEGRLLLANQAAERMFDFEEKKAIGKHLIETVRDYEIDRTLKSCLETAKEHTAQLEFGPGKRFLRVIAVPLMTDGLTGSLLLFQDLTELKSLQTMRRELVGNISHELRTPLAGIKAIVETLQDGAVSDKKVARDFLVKIDSEIDRMMQMVMELTELSRIESGRGDLKPEMVNLNSLVEEVIARFKPQAERKSVALSTDLFTGLPRIQADKDRIYQVITNLVHNAIKFTSQNGKVNISTELSENSVLVKVSDTGVGISREDLPRVFERFYKADKARVGEGAGLGLAIAKHVVQAHGGNIWVESKEGKGSTFFFDLPFQTNPH